MKIKYVFCTYIFLGTRLWILWIRNKENYQCVKSEQQLPKMQLFYPFSIEVPILILWPLEDIFDIPKSWLHKEVTLTKHQKDPLYFLDPYSIDRYLSQISGARLLKFVRSCSFQAKWHKWLEYITLSYINNSPVAFCKSFYGLWC